MKHAILIILAIFVGILVRPQTVKADIKSGRESMDDTAGPTNPLKTNRFSKAYAPPPTTPTPKKAYIADPSTTPPPR